MRALTRLPERARGVGGELPAAASAASRALALAIQSCAGVRARVAATCRDRRARPAISSCAAATSMRASTSAGVVAGGALTGLMRTILPALACRRSRKPAGGFLRAGGFQHGRQQRAQFMRERGFARQAGGGERRRAAPALCRRRRAIWPARARPIRARRSTTASRNDAALSASRAGLVGGRRSGDLVARAS